MSVKFVVVLDGTTECTVSVDDTGSPHAKWDEFTIGMADRIASGILINPRVKEGKFRVYRGSDFANEWRIVIPQYPGQPRATEPVMRPSANPYIPIIDPRVTGPMP